MSDAETFLALLAVNGLLSLGSGGLLTRRKPEWTRRKVTLIAAAPVPGTLGVLAALLVLNAFFDAITDRESCGVDACGMEMAFGTIVLVALLLVYVLTLVPAWIGAKLAK